MHDVLSSDALAQAIDSACGFLSTNQRPDGEFSTYEFATPALDGRPRFGSSPFATSLIVYNLEFVANSETMIARGLDFLEQQMEDLGLWRYWSKQNDNRTFLPPDLDDTSCASFCLRRYGRTAPDNLQSIVGNAADDGTFYTWIAPRSHAVLDYWREVGYRPAPEQFLRLALSELIDDVDCVANANVVLYLGDREESRRAIEYLIAAAKTNGDSDFSRYYVHIFSYYYMLSRAFFSGVSALAPARDSIVARILRDDSRWTHSPLESAFAICTLVNFLEGSRIPKEAVQALMDAQRDDGSWPREIMFKGAGVVPGPYYGSEELTTGFCLEALARYRSLSLGTDR